MLLKAKRTVKHCLDTVANQAAQQASNTAQGQAFGEAQSGYNSAYQAALEQYMEPLNAMNAVETGQQVNVPGITSPNTTAGNTSGADYTNAAAQQGSWDQGIYNAQQAATGQTEGRCRRVSRYCSNGICDVLADELFSGNPTINR